MDNLCHSLAGAALGRAGLASRTTLGMSTLVIANNLPDVDVAVFATNTLAMSFRRGWTHGVLAQALLPVALTGIMLAYDRLVVQRRANAPLPAVARELLLLSYLGVLLHVFMDLMNSYGVRLLMPFSGQWFYGDALFIVDPWLYLALGMGWWRSRRRQAKNRALASRPARVGVALAAAYILLMVMSNVAARAAVREGLERAGRPPGTRFMVTPVAVNPFRREVVVDVGDRYEKGHLWFEPLPHFRPAGFGMPKGFDDPEARQALQSPRAQAFLLWSRFPFVQVDRNTSPPAIWINDYRYANAGPYGWSATRSQ
ncbi:MAG: metal-dependent hydrolase [Vicinamibacterales bacterium]